MLLELTRDFGPQSAFVEEIDAVLLTHSHRDASGGVPRLRRWLHERSAEPIDVYASAETIAASRGRYVRLDCCRFIEVRDGERHRVGRVTVTALTVPQALDPHCPTFAWKLRAGPNAVVYASDVARLTSAP